MKELLRFYFNPQNLPKNYNRVIFFKISLITYFFTIILYSIISLIFSDKATLSPSLTPDSLTFILIRTVGLLLKAPIQILLLTVGVYISLNLILRDKLSFLVIYKLLFISFNIVIASYFVDIINIFTKYYTNFQFINMFKYSLNDVFIKAYDCSEVIASFLSRINLLSLLSIFYSFFLLKNLLHLPNNKLLMIIVPTSILFILLLLSAIPMFLLNIFKLATP